MLSSLFLSTLRPARSMLMSTYESVNSLKNLYPKSNLSVIAPVEPPQSTGTEFSGYIPLDKLEITYSRSSGPGGQHVNKVASKVDLRFHVSSASWLSEDIRRNILEVFKSRITKDGYLVIKSEKTRSQLYNQAYAMTILREMIRRAENLTKTNTPSEETLLQLRKRKEKQNRERLFQKRQHSLKKLSRSDSGDL